MNTLTNGQIFLYETLGTAMLLLLGCGVVATAILRDSKGFGGGWLLINFGWGLGVFAGVYVAFPAGAHLNPAVTVAQLITGQHHRGQVDLLLPRRVPRCLPRRRARLGRLQAALRRRGGRGHQARRVLHRPGHPQLRLEPRHRGHRHLRADLPHPRSPAARRPRLGPLFVALVVVGIGASLGGPTGYAINPARDLGPRIAHAILPIKGKGARTGATPGCRSSARSSARSSPRCCSRPSARRP